MMIGMGTACGDYIIRGLRYWDPTCKNKILQHMKASTKVVDGQRSGRLYYCVLGTGADPKYDAMLEEIGFKKVGETLNSAHHNGTKKIRSYAVCSTDLWDMLSEASKYKSFEDLLEIYDIGPVTVEALQKRFETFENFKRFVVKGSSLQVQAYLEKLGINWTRSANLYNTFL